MAGKIKSISDPRLHLDILSSQDVERIHTATLDVLENTGVRFPSIKALDIWEAHGALVDRDTMIEDLATAIRSAFAAASFA